MKIGIIGGGIAGLVTAYQLARTGHDVTLREACTLASGASGKALGVLVPVTGLDRPIDRLQRQGIAAWPALAAELAKVTGTPLPTFWRDWGGGRQQLNMRTVFGILAQGIAHHGGVVRENAAVAEVDALLADYDRVIVACGWGNHALVGAPLHISAGLAGRFTGPLDGLVAADNLFLCPESWPDFKGSVLAGSINWRMDAPGDGAIPPVKMDEFLRRVHAVAPQLELQEAWVGYRPAQTPRVPLITTPQPRLHVVTGLGKIGLGLAPILSDLVT